MLDTFALDERLLETPRETAAAGPSTAATLEASNAEAERCARHQSNLNRLRSYVTQAAGKTAVQIGKAIDIVAQIPADASVWEEFALEAEQVKAEVLCTLGQLKDETAKTEIATATAIETEIETDAQTQGVAPVVPEAEASIETSEQEAVEIAMPVLALAPPAATVASVPSLETLGLLRAALELTEYTATPFAGRFPTHPKPSGEWWAGLRQRLDALQPGLLTALGLSPSAPAVSTDAVNHG